MQIYSTERKQVTGLQEGVYSSRETARRTVDAHQTTFVPRQRAQEQRSSGKSKSQGTYRHFACIAHGRNRAWQRVYETMLAELHKADQLDWSRVIVDSFSVRAVFGGPNLPELHGQA